MRSRTRRRGWWPTTRRTARRSCSTEPRRRRKESCDEGPHHRGPAAHAAEAERLLLRDGGQARARRVRRRTGRGQRGRRHRRARRSGGAVPADVRQPPRGDHRGRRRDDRFRQAHDLRARRRRLQEASPRDRRRLPRVLRQALPRHDAGRCARPVRRRRRRADRDRGVRGTAVSAVAERFKIRHRLPPARWPTREEAARARLFQPARIGPIVAEQRTWVPAMVPWRATEDGFVTEEVLAWYARFAEGRPGVLVVEATGIRDIPSGPLLRIGDDRFLPGLARLVDTVREKSHGRTRLFIQIIDFLTVRRRPEPEKYFARYLPITDALRVQLALWLDDKRWREATEDEVRRFLREADSVTLETVLTDRELEALDYGYRERVWDLHLPWIRELPRVLPALFAEAARRAQAAGFDGVELHYAHAYTMASFLSRLNTRTDGYGASLDGRVRLPLEVLRAVRARVGP